MFLDLKGHRIHLSIIGFENYPLSQNCEMYEQQDMTIHGFRKQKYIITKIKVNNMSIVENLYLWCIREIICMSILKDGDGPSTPL